ncbi:MAG: tRNA (N(6)-L-threonylcarbamoyladenosine(37)-C(2))-methylthiotransferase MtaB [Treponema sp.]|nr:tRNA (N(6)-L-threonylcarbamoyladenosine(37)-C(2))-methylthiotransferase MtaB [Treponema sp.]
MLCAVKSVFQNISDKKTVHIETLGCRLNQIESEGAADFFSKGGFNVVMKGITASDNVDEKVILALINTCTVTAKAEQKARRIMRLLLKKYPSALVLVTGCYAQVAKKEIESIDKRILVLPGRVKSRLIEIPALVNDVINLKKTDAELTGGNIQISEKIKKIIENKICLKPVSDTSENPFLLSSDTFLHHSRASLKIQDGCNNRCSYCEICIARGLSVSLDAGEVLNRVLKLKEAGHREIVITTVNAAQYRSEYEGQSIDIAGLLELLLKKTKDVSFRFSSLYPQIIDEKFSELLKDKRVRPHFHLSVQSGSDNVLKNMNRPYKAEQVLKAVMLLKKARPDCFTACDIIAGFPGETDEDFEKTVKLVKECGFTYVHAFPFSPRPNTKAYSMKPHVPEAVTQKRVQKLLDYSVKAKIDYINSICGTVRTAIVETSHSKILKKGISDGKEIINAVTDNFLHCRVECTKGQLPEAGEEVDIEIILPLEDEIKKNAEMEVHAKLCS